MDNKKLPKGWEWRKLKDISIIKKGTSITQKKVTEGTIPVIAGGRELACYDNQSNRDKNIITVSASGAYAGYVNFFTYPIFASDCVTVKSNDETQIPSKLDCKGTGAITDLADNCFTVWRNKAKEEITQMKLNGVTLDLKQSAKLEECDCIWRCDKQRNGEWEGKTALWFDKQSFQYLGKPDHKAKQFVEFSISNK